MPPTLEMCRYLPLPQPELQTAALSQLLKNQRLASVNCTSAFDMSAYTLVLVETPEVPPAELRAAMLWRVKDLIDFPVDDAVIDLFDLPAQKSSGRSRMVYVVVTRTAVVKQRADLLLDAGFRLTTLDIPELCLRNITALLPEDVGGVAFIYLAHGRGLITLTRQSTLYMSRRLQTGADILWERNLDSVTPEIERWLDSVVIEVQRSLDYYESHFSAPPIAGLVLAPLGRQVAGVPEYLSSQLGLPCRVLDLNELIDTRERLSAELQAQCLTAIGAALRTETRAAA